MSIDRPHREHFQFLDGLRGVAAIGVLLFHFQRYLPLPVMGSGYLAVDFFFMLSGFVVAYAYGPKLGHGLSLRRFAALRLIRLYPAIFVVLLASAALNVAKVRSGHGQAGFSYHAIVWPLVTGLLILPTWPSALNPKWVYPLNNNMWSLFFELAANAMFAVIAPKLTLRGLTIMTALSVAAYLFTGYWTSMQLAGATPADFWWGLPRCAAPFWIGVLLFRLRQDGRLRVPTIPAPIIAVALAAVLAPPALGPLYELPVVLLVFPLIITCAVKEARSAANRHPIWSWLGLISYPLYLIQAPFRETWPRIAETAHVLQRPIFAASSIVMAILLAYLLGRFYERPAVARLRAALDGYSARRLLAKERNIASVH